MRLPRLIWGIVVLAGSACQTHRIGSDVGESAVRMAELRARAAQAPVLIRTTRGESWIQAANLQIGPDSIHWEDELGAAIAVYRAEVEAVRFERRQAAALGWGLVGLSAGALAGDQFGTDEDDWWAVPEVYLGAGLGAALGMLLGLETGLPVTYRFDSD